MFQTEKFLQELLKINIDETIWKKRYFINKTEEFLNFYKIDIKDILKNKDLRKLFLNYIFNHYTTFFRDYEIFRFIREIKPKRVLSIGCSSGEEVYSIAIILYENGILNESFILGIDIEDIIKEAKKGEWNKSLYKEFERNYKSSGGKKDFKNYFVFEEDKIKIKNFIKQKVTFKSYDLREFINLGKFDLILFQNISIYFDDKFLKKVYNWINEQLNMNGYLIVDDNEICLNYLHIKNNIYQKKENKSAVCYKKEEGVELNE